MTPISREPRASLHSEEALGIRYSFLDFREDLRSFGEALKAPDFDPLSWAYSRYSSPQLSEERMLRYSAAGAYIEANKTWLDCEPYAVYGDGVVLLRDSTWFTLWYLWARDAVDPKCVRPTHTEFSHIHAILHKHREG
jgi:hypothetical protein